MNVCNDLIPSQQSSRLNTFVLLKIELKTIHAFLVVRIFCALFKRWVKPCSCILHSLHITPQRTPQRTEKLHQPHNNHEAFYCDLFCVGYTRSGSGC